MAVQAASDGIQIDGQMAGTPYAGETLLQYLIRQGVNVPHICFQPPLPAPGTCDTCLVQVNGTWVRSCVTNAESGMNVSARTSDVLAAEKEALFSLLEDHELACTLCDNNNGTCPVHNMVEDLHIEHQPYPYRPKGYPEDATNPFYVYRPDHCILCGRCVEACQNVEVNETLSIDWSAPTPRVVWDGGKPINESSCVSCGQCVTACPVDALMEKSMVGQAGYLSGMPEKSRRVLLDVTKAVEPSFTPLITVSNIEASMRASRIQKTKTVCTYCGVGCSFEVWTRDRQILKIEPKPESPANQMATCIKGKFGWDFVNSPERLTTPLVRRHGTFVAVTWDEALAEIRSRVQEIQQRHGPDSVMVIGSSKCTNEEAYLTQKLARQVLHTNNVDNCSRYCQSPATTGLWRTVGYGGDSGSMTDIEQASLVVIVGSNTAESHPVLASKVKRAHKTRGQQLIVADLRRHEMAERADLFLHPRPGTDLVWLSAVTRYILDQGWADQRFLAAHVNGLEEYQASLEPFTLAYAADVTGLSEESLKQAATLIHQAESVAMLWAMGVTQHQGGSDTSTAISNLLLVTGNYGRAGTGAYPLRGHNNVQGASDFGCMPNFLPGYQSVTDPEVRGRFADAWGPLPDSVGLDNHQMVDAIHDGRVHAVYLIGEELTVVDAHQPYVDEAVRKLDFLVVQDVFFSRTAQFADVILPAAPSLEKDGTFTSTERRIQRLYRALKPLGQSRPDWEILMAVANALGAEWAYRHPSDIMDEAARLTPLFAGVAYNRLEGFASLQWPVEETGQDTPLLYDGGQFHFPDGKARLFPLAWEPPLSGDVAYDLHLNNGRLLEHFHEGHLTYKTPGIREKVPQTFVEVSPALAEERGLQDGDRVRLESRWGQVRVSVLVTSRVTGRELYLPMNDAGDAAVNRLTSWLSDRVTHTPAFKELPVRLIKLESTGEPPLPRVNPRFATRDPHSGAEAELKRSRKDYVPPPQRRDEKAGGQ